MKVDYKKLKQGLGELTGYDFAAAEQQARILGDGTPEIVYSKTFHAVIAAKVLGVTIDDIKGLPIREYIRLQVIVWIIRASVTNSYGMSMCTSLFGCFCALIRTP